MVETRRLARGAMNFCDECGQETVLPPDTVCDTCLDDGESVDDQLGTQVGRVDASGLARLSDDAVRTQVTARAEVYDFLREIWHDYKRLDLTNRSELRPLGELIDVVGTLMITASQEQLGRETGSRSQQPPLVEYVEPAAR